MIGPPLLQALWVELMLQSPVRNAAPLLTQAYWLWWLSIPACAAAALLAGYRLIVRDRPDPRLDFALVYFSFGIVALLGISVFLMIDRRTPHYESSAEARSELVSLELGTGPGPKLE